MKFESFFC